MRKRRAVWITALLAVALSSVARAERLDPGDIPEPLLPWVGWALHGHERETCALVGESGGICAWPSRLELDLRDDGGVFRQEWWVEVKSRVDLPGGAGRWPEEVLVDGNPAVVTSRGVRPVLELPPGRHVVSGVFLWSELPPTLEIPPQSGLLELRMDGRQVLFPTRDEQGRLWVKHREQAVKSEDTLEVVVQRRVVDAVPMQLDTRIELKVSGRNREVLLGKVLLSGFTPMSLSSPVPVRIEPDGRLRVQLRPGLWKLQLTARQDNAPTAPFAELALGDPGGPWDAEEVWVFEAHPDLRLVQVEGVAAIDPKQTSLEPEWQGLPAYLMKSGDVMKLVEKQRGDAGRAPDRLALDRTWWLDFDGVGVTVRDRISGAIGANARLSMVAPTALGRAALNGEDQLITRLTEDGPLGIEIRQGNIEIEADSRIEGSVSSMPAVGWVHDFHSVEGTFKLPPGWRLIHARGVDDVSRSWLASWTLLDIFLALVTIVGFFRLWGVIWGVLAAGTMLMTWVEPGAPQAVWIAVLAGEALVRAVGKLDYPRLLSALRAYRAFAVVVLVLMGASFVIGEARKAIFPVLERSYVAVGETAAREGVDKKLQKRVRALGYADDAFSGAEEEREYAPKTLTLGSSSYGSRRAQMLAPDPNARVQTGPGVPSWDWNQVELRWRGPVERSQTVDLILLSPAVNRILGFVRVLLVLALLLCVLRAASGLWSDFRQLAASPIAVAILGLLLSAAPAARADESPSPELLNQLRERLLEKPPCSPDCVSSPRLDLEVSDDRLTIRIVVEAAARSAVALPGGGRQWSPQEVLVDGRQAQALLSRAGDQLWLLVEAGKHEVLLRGALPPRDDVQIHLPTQAHRVTARTDGWSLGGVRRDGGAEGNLQLTRVASQSKEAVALEPGRLPPFVEVKRELVLGLTWSVETTVTRLSPTGTAAVLEIPLLPNESVISAGIEVDEGRATVTLGPNSDAAAWKSVLKPSDSIRLEALPAANATERWLVSIGPIWHVEASGIPAVHQAAGELESTLEWRPWTGEVVELQVTRPGGAVGRTLTIDSSIVTLNPGLRATDAALRLTMRSSRGTQHEMMLPPDADLESVAIDGTEQPIRPVGRKLTLPIAPGRHFVDIKWRESRGVETVFRAPPIDVGSTSVNAAVQVNMPRDRWTLFAGGLQVGPVILFWPLLVVLAPLSFLLGRIDVTPLRGRHWFTLGLGLTQIPISMSFIVVGWLLALGWRGRSDLDLPARSFNLVQLVIVAWTGVALLLLAFAIQQGLLGLPEMQITGNGSRAHYLRWFEDRTANLLPEVWVLSVSVLFYRAAMLLWALWLTQALLRWLRWGWACFTEGGLWKARASVVPSD